MLTDAKEILDRVARDFGGPLYWHIRRIVVRHDDAEDALQEAFIKIYTKASSFSGNEDSLKAWAYKIATREALQTLRRRSRLFQSLDSVSRELAGMVGNESPEGSGDGSVLLQKAILSLSTQQRIVFNLRYYDEMPYEEIAAVTGKSEGALRTNYHYASEKIKEYLKENTI